MGSLLWAPVDSLCFWLLRARCLPVVGWYPEVCPPAGSSGRISAGTSPTTTANTSRSPLPPPFTLKSAGPSTARSATWSTIPRSSTDLGSIATLCRFPEQSPYPRRSARTCHSKCSHSYKQQCSTKYEQECNTIYVDDCKTSYEQECSTRYEQKCETVTERECSTDEYGNEKCWDEPRQKCEQVPKEDCHSVPRQA